MSLVFMFPGQSSRDEAMFERLANLLPTETSATFDEASEVLHRDLADHYRADNQRMFASNRDVQVGVFLANHMYMKGLQALGIEADLSLGLSLGEYNHLVHIQALDFATALRLVDRRGSCYDAGPAGSMVCVWPTTPIEIQEIVARSAGKHVLEIATFNSPSQYVLAGESEAIEAVIDLVDREYFAHTVLIENRLPMHCSIFEPVGRAFAPDLASASWQNPTKPYISNVEPCFLEDASAADMCDRLTRHVYQPVQWRTSIDLIVDRAPDVTFLEVGSRQVLYNLLTRDWHTNRKFRTDAPELVETLGQLRDERLVGA